jgi:hypothetical protein
LMELAKRCELYDIQHGFVEETYLMRDNTVLMTRENIIHEKARYKIEMTISEGCIKDDTWRLRYINLDR